MPEYSYQAIDSDGQSVTGQLSADSVSQAIVELEGRGLSVESIWVAARAPAPPSPSQADRPGQADLGAPFSSSELDGRFDSVIDRREVLMPALAALAEEMPPGRARGEIRHLVGELERAQTAMDLRRSKLALQWLPLLASGFTTESSTHRMSDLIAHASRESQNRSQRRLLFAYPLTVLLLVLAVFSFLCALVVPTFHSMFNEFGLRLPLPTRMVVFIADQALDHPMRFVLAVATISVVIYGLFVLWHHFALTTRLLGGLTSGNTASVSAMSSLTGQLAELLSIDVSLPDALWTAGHGCQHYHFQNVAEQLAREAHGGTLPLSDSPIAHNLPLNVYHALQAGPDGGPNIPLLRELSAIYSDRASQRVDWASGAMAQFAVVVLGIVVGFLVIAVFSPLVSLISGLT